MNRALRFTLSTAILVIPFAVVTASSGSSADPPPRAPDNPTTRAAGLQHWCGSNGVNCTEPARDWDEYPGYDKAIDAGANFLGYIGHDEPATLFYSHQPGSGNDVTYQMRLPKDPPTGPMQNGSGGTDNFQKSIAFWLGMVVCDKNGSPNPDGAALTGHPTVPCEPDSDSNIYANPDPSSPRYFGLGPGQAYEEMQFYPPGWVSWPAGTSCDATHWCAALNIDTFSTNENTGQFNNVHCLNTVGPEPVNFAFLTKSGVADSPANPKHPEHFTPNLAHDLLMNPGDDITVRLFDTPSGLRVSVVDRTTFTEGSMTASAANGFGTVEFDPSASKCTVDPYDYHPMYSTSTPQTRNFAAAHTYNIAFSDEIGHFEYCGRIGTDPFSTCVRPLGPDTNDGDNHGPDPEGDDDFCLPGSASTSVKISGCLDIDGDFDGPSYDFNWQGSISNPTADSLLNPTSVLFTSPTTGGKDFSSMVFESDISRDESSDTSFRVDTPCQRHLLNPSDPDPGVGCVNPPPNSVFYPFYSTRNEGGTCMWQEGGPYIPGTTNRFGGSARAEYGPLRAISYPSHPFGTITKRYNDFRSDPAANPCPATSG